MKFSFSMMCYLALALLAGALNTQAYDAAVPASVLARPPVDASTAQAARNPTIDLLPEAQVESHGIYLDQILTTTNVAHIRLAAAPSFGMPMVLSRAQIAELIKKNVPDLATSPLAGAVKIRITRQSRHFTEEDLIQLLTDTLQHEYAKNGGQVEIKLKRSWQTVNMPNEPLTIRIVDAPTSGLTAIGVIRCELDCGQEVLGTWPVPIEARLWRDVWVAQSPLKRGDRLQTSNLTRERRDVLQLRDAFDAKEIDDESLELTENIPTGNAILNRSVRIRPVITRGKTIDAVVQSGIMLITVKAQALEDGIAGQTIRVRNAKSGGEFRGKVQNEQTVQVNL